MPKKMKFVLDWNSRKVLYQTFSMKGINQFIEEYYPEYFDKTHTTNITIAIEKLREVV
jgi:hypothetical protein